MATPRRMVERGLAELVSVIEICAAAEKPFNHSHLIRLRGKVESRLLKKYFAFFGQSPPQC